MKKIELLYGMLLGLLTAFLGVYLFIILLTDYDFIEGLSRLKKQGQLGKVIAIGSVLNLVIFFLLLKLKKELVARGIVLAVLIVTILTLVV